MQLLKPLFLSCLLGIVSVMAFAQTKLQPDFHLESSLKSGDSHLYELRLKKGDYAEVTFLQQGVDLDVTLLNEAKDSIGYLDTPNGIEGPEIYKLQATYSGTYYFQIEPLTPEDEGLTDKSSQQYIEYVAANHGAYSVESVKVLTAKEYQQQLAEEAAHFQRIASWFEAKSQPLVSVEAGKGFEDLQFLKPILKEVQIVGLGEATHGTREFFQMKHRMLEFLVREMDYRVFAIEASYPACQNINDYVLHGIGTKEKALASQGFWTWDTEEVLDMIEWIRQYNLTVPTEKRVQFLGFDVQVLQRSVAEVDTFLVSTDAGLSGKFREIMELRKPILPFSQTADTLLLEQVDRQYNEVLADMILSEGRLTELSSKEAYARGVEHLRIVIQGWRTVKSRLFREVNPEKRDYYMADNLIYLRNKLQPGTKIVIWAHNGHVSADPEAPINGGIKPMGAYLREMFGDAYYSMSFAFNQGGFQAFSRGGLADNKNGLKGYNVEPAAERTLEWIFSQTGKSIAFLDLRQPLPEELETYFQSEVLTFGTGAMFFPQGRAPGRYPLISDYTTKHDGIIFVDTTTRARPSEAVKNRMAVE